MLPLFSIVFIALAMPILGKNLEGRVVGGVDANLGDIPYIVSLRTSSGSHNCGGVLISRNFVLTAAHCAYSAASIQYAVVDIDENANDETVIPVSKQIIHEGYYGSENDIALLLLERPAFYDKYVQPANLPDQNEPVPDGSNVLLAGWGYNATAGILPTRLQKVNISVVENEKCNSIHNDPIYDSNLCAGVPEGWKGQCNGDSGGPLTYNGKVVGLVSWSVKPCTVPPYPGVYTRVASFRHWITINSGV